ncbi:alpha/beta hydrolase family protein [Burkholderia ubonensis]|uniref:alpha/beta hydrolase family protein n=1 Tax=Burkholderia ubonensis TaxID=101571 RepID=UPI000A9EA493|nr:prolyl oligopeptidase family serine peptidase [Burkholderia ubonensis]
MKTIVALLLTCCLAGESSLTSATDLTAVERNTEHASTLSAARKNFKTQIALEHVDAAPAPTPPKGIFLKIAYMSPVGLLAAYLTPAPKDGRRHPAIVWITGGDTNSLDDNPWKPNPRTNEQSASAYRNAGIVMMFPSLRGGNDNPKKKEIFYGETDDVLAAADFLARLPYVDPTRIYLGGHSTGGTLVLLTAEVSDRFRAVFSFGPVGRIDLYDKNTLIADFSKYDKNETILRSPEFWLSSIHSRVFIIDGERQPTNIGSIELMQQQTMNPYVRFLRVKGADHFTVLAPCNELIAQKILLDTGPTVNIILTEQELAALFVP